MIKATQEHWLIYLCEISHYEYSQLATYKRQLHVYQLQADFVLAGYSTTHFTSILIMR